MFEVAGYVRLRLRFTVEVDARAEGEECDEECDEDRDICVSELGKVYSHGHALEGGVISCQSNLVSLRLLIELALSSQPSTSELTHV